MSQRLAAVFRVRGDQPACRAANGSELTRVLALDYDRQQARPSVGAARLAHGLNRERQTDNR